MAQYPHLFVPSGPDPSRFTSPNSAREKFSLPPRNRTEHADRLIAKLEALALAAQQQVERQRAHGLDNGYGVYLTFESEPNFDLKFESLDLVGSGIELCTVKTTADNRAQATVFVPDGGLELFLNRVTAYQNKDTKPRKESGPIRPRNQKLVESISDIRLAALEALWTEVGEPFPAVDDVITWEVWLRSGRAIDHLARLRAHAGQFNLLISPQTIIFIDRVIVLVRSSARQLSQSIEILGMIAEVRLPKTTAAFFTKMSAIEQQEWVDDLIGRLALPGASSPYVCLLDTGLNHAHPVLANIADVNDLHTYRPAWGTDDRQGHGTPMAGLAVIGDITDALSTTGSIAVPHRLESVKIFNRYDPHAPELYGAVTQESAFRVEVIPDRRRVYCMAITATDGRDRGRPSSWSAAIDALAVGSDGGPRRLFILSAGNTNPDQRRHYPHANETDGIHDPAQSWNALTVGGYTEKVIVDTAQYPGWSALAPHGDLAPSSCTSMTWGKWPIKPDIVMEAGNMAQHPAHQDPDYIDDGLQLLTLNHAFARAHPLTTFGDTSAATAQAARLAGTVWSKYPSLTPEAVRALMVHAADWTPAMLGRFTRADGSIDYQRLVRCFGFGAPNEKNLLSSLNNSLTLIVESELHPFVKEGGRVKTQDMRLHPLPWPGDILTGLANTLVTMRVTLSYFIEPSPGARGWTPRYGYQSHGLRFAVKHPLENEKAFARRVNAHAREVGYRASSIADPGWRFGYGLRSLTSTGSIHSDVWKGTAAGLAARGCVAVYPTMGWWNKRPHLNAFKGAARYALIVTIATKAVDADIYTPVATQIGVPILVET